MEDTKNAEIVNEVMEDGGQEQEKETTEDFNAGAFGANVEEQEEESDDDGQDDEQDEGYDEDGFSWDSVKLEEEAAEEEEVEEDEDDGWDYEASDEDEEVDDSGIEPWEVIAHDLGVEVESYDELKNMIANKLNPAPVSNKVETLRSYLKYTDKQLLMADFVSQGMTKEEAKDEVQSLSDIGLLKREALGLKRNIRDAADAEERRVKEEHANAQQEEAQEIEDNREELIEFLKEKDNFFGGKVSKKERQELFRYITIGGFDNDVNASHANVAEMAFLWKNHKKIFKMLQSDGFEQGKSHVLDGITSPDLGRRAARRKPSKPSDFDAGAFTAR